jgi:septal ring factor EnvC (AmiA/AmiB activator)
MIEGLRIQVAEINTTLRFIRGIGYVLAASSLAILLAVIGAVSRAGQIENTVADLGRDFAEMKIELKEMRAEMKAELKETRAEMKIELKEIRKDIAELKADFKAQAGQLDRIEKALVQNPPAHPKPTPIAKPTRLRIRACATAPDPSGGLFVPTLKRRGQPAHA